MVNRSLEGWAPAQPKTEELGGRGSCRAETAANSEWRVASSFSGGQCSCTAENFRHIWRCALQHYRKIFSAHQEMRHPEFFAERIRRSEKSVKSHVPCPSLAEASGMGRKIVKGLHPALSTPHLYAPLHSCTLAPLHACTPTRLHAGL
jgi:hypothetical protein